LGTSSWSSPSWARADNARLPELAAITGFITEESSLAGKWLELLASLNRPGGNLTGSSSLVAELTPKRLQLLRELIPSAVRFGVLLDPAFPDTQSVIADLQAAARTLGRQLIVNVGSAEPVVKRRRPRRHRSSGT
jgi:hypothetical protein